MKTMLMLIILLLSSQLQAQAACKCNCNLGDVNICASSYDIDNPCTGLCPASSAPGILPMRTACPVTQIFNPATGVSQWVTLCND